MREPARNTKAGSIMKKQTPTTQAEARQYAIDWQNWISDSETKLSYGELADWQQEMQDLAVNWDLVEEFQENGII
jgi:hypothetical protein